MYEELKRKYKTNNKFDELKVKYASTKPINKDVKQQNVDSNNTLKAINEKLGTNTSVGKTALMTKANEQPKTRTIEDVNKEISSAKYQLNTLMGKTGYVNDIKKSDLRKQLNDLQTEYDNLKNASIKAKHENVAIDVQANLLNDEELNNKIYDLQTKMFTTNNPTERQAISTAISNLKNNQAQRTQKEEQERQNIQQVVDGIENVKKTSANTVKNVGVGVVDVYADMLGFVAKNQKNVADKTVDILNKMTGQDKDVRTIFDEVIDITEGTHRWANDTSQNLIADTNGGVGKWLVEQGYHIGRQITPWVLGGLTGKAIGIGANTVNAGNIATAKGGKVINAIKKAGKAIKGQFSNPSTAYFVAGAGGSYLRDAEQRGLTGDKALAYAWLMGGVEGTTEAISLDFLGKAAGNLAKGQFKQMAINYVIGGLEEMVQEGIIEPISESTAKMLGGEYSYENMIQRMFEAGVDGLTMYVLLGGISAGYTKAAQVVGKAINGNQVTQAEIEEAIEEIVANGGSIEQAYQDYTKAIESYTKYINDNTQVAYSNKELQQREDNNAKLQELNKEYELLSRTEESIYNERDKAQTKEDIEMYNEDIKAVQKRISEVTNMIDNIEKNGRNIEQAVIQAKQEFGITNDFKEAGYLLQDGTMLDFSGKNQGSNVSGRRTLDHRDIQSVNYEMREFMEAGNIRLQPESNGFELMQEPTPEQYKTLSEYIDNTQGEVVIDIYKDNGMNRYDSASYKQGTPTAKVINDIKTYFKTGKFPSKSMVAEFRYSNKKLEPNTKVDISKNKVYNKITKNEKMQVQREVMTWRAEQPDGIGFIDLSANGYKSYSYIKNENDVTVLQGYTGSEQFINEVRSVVLDEINTKSIRYNNAIEIVRNRFKNDYGSNDVSARGQQSRSGIEKGTRDGRQQRRSNISENVGDNGNNLSDGKNEIKIVEPKDKTQKLIQEFMKENFNIDVQYYTSNKDFKAIEFVRSDTPRTIYVRNNSKNDMLWATGHGFLHTLKHNHEDVFNELIEFVKKDISQSQIDNYISQVRDIEYQNRLKKNNDMVIEEMIADEMGNNFVDRSWWEKLLEYSKELFDKVVKLLKDVLNKISGKKYRNELTTNQVKKLNQKILQTVNTVIQRENIAKNNMFVQVSNARKNANKNKPVTIDYAKQKEIQENNNQYITLEDDVPYNDARLKYTEDVTDVRTGYEKVPDNLMGFSKEISKNKPSDKTNYPYILDCWVSVDGGETFFNDEIRGLNYGHALERAKRNWDVLLGAGEIRIRVNNVAKDNKGRTLTKEQQEYFKDSKVRDENGRLLEVYHGTEANFNIYKSNSREYFFTDNENASVDYGSIIKKQYLNLTNPYIVDFEGKSDKGIFDAIDYAKTNGYDGVIAQNTYDGANSHNQYVAFYPEQIKNVDNKKPTTNPDIRYSNKNNVDKTNKTTEDSKDNWMIELEKKKKIKQFTDKTLKDIEEIKTGEKASKKKFIKELAQALEISRYANKEVLENTANELVEFLKSGQPLYNKTQDKIFDKLYKGLNKTDTIMYEQYKDLKKEIRQTKLYVSDTIKNDIADYNDFRKMNMGTLTLTNDKSNTAIDVFYEDLSLRYPDMFPMNIENATDQLLQIADVQQDIVKIPMSFEEYANKHFGSEFVKYAKKQFNEAVEGLKESLRLDAKGSKIAQILEEVPREETFVEILKQEFKVKDKSTIDKVVDIAKKSKPNRAQFYMLCQQLFINKGYAIDKLASDTGNKEITYKYDKFLSAIAEGQQCGTEGQTDNYGHIIGKSINEIWNPIEKAGLVQEFDGYLLHRHNIDRMSKEGNLKKQIQEYQQKNYQVLYEITQNGELTKDILESIDLEVKADTKKQIRQQKKEGKSEEEIEVVIEPQKKVAKEFLDMLIRYEEIRNAPVFGEEVTASVSKKIVEEYEKQYPQMKEWAKDVDQYNKNFLECLVDAGLVREEAKQIMENMYSHYVRIQRDNSTRKRPLVNEQGNLKIKNPIQKATGGNSDILPLKEMMAEYTITIKQNIRLNLLGQELFKELGGKELETYENKYEKSTKDKPAKLVIFVDGVPTEVEVTDDIIDALAPDGTGPVSKFLDKYNFLKPLVSLKRAVTTQYNVLFIAVNTIRDFQQAMMNTKYKKNEFIRTWLAGLQMIASDAEFWQVYRSSGNVQNSFYKYETRTLSDDGKRIEVLNGRRTIRYDLIAPFTHKINSKTVLEILKIPFAIIDTVNSALEQSYRFAEFLCTLNHGGTWEEALYNANDITINFKRGGKLVKTVDRNAFPFLNVSFLGVDKIGRMIGEPIIEFKDGYKRAREDGKSKIDSAKEGWKETQRDALRIITGAVMFGIIPQILNSFVYKDDEDYEELPSYVKDKYYVIKTEDDKFVTIPKERVLSILQATLRRYVESTDNPEQTLSECFGEIMKLFGEQVGPVNPFDNFVLTPFIQAQNNQTWFGEEIENQTLQSRLPSERYDEKTDEFSKWFANTEIAKQFGWSPKQINYVIDQMSGGFYDIFAPAFTKYAEGNPVSNKFMKDTIYNNVNSEKFYEVKDELTQLRNYEEEHETKEDTLTSVKLAYINSKNQEVSDLYKQIRKIQNSDLFTDKEKITQSEKYRKEIVNIQRATLEKLDTVTKMEDLPEQYLNTAYFEADKDINGNSISGSSAGKKAYWIMNESNLSTAEKNDLLSKITNTEAKQTVTILKKLQKSEDVYKYYYGLNDTGKEKYISAVADTGINQKTYIDYKNKASKITADKDSNGDTISGSKKKKIITEIAKLKNTSTTEKLYLIYLEGYTIKSGEIQGYTENSARNTVANWILNMKLTTAEKIKILEYVGYDVNDGRVTWK